MDLDKEATRRINGSDKNVGSIEEDIKILENLLEEGFEAMCYSEAQAIEHLIKAYKELKETNQLLLNSKIGVDLSFDDYIPVSLVKEKIEEYEEKAKRIAGTYQYADSNEDLESKKKQVIELRTKSEGLQELLEGE